MDEKDLTKESVPETAVTENAEAPVVKKTRTRKKSAAQLNKKSDGEIPSSSEIDEVGNTELSPEAVAEPTLSARAENVSTPSESESYSPLDEEQILLSYSDTEDEGYPENYSFSSFFAISASDFSATYGDTAEVSEQQLESETKLPEDDPITPPDELFSRRPETTEPVTEEPEETAESVAQEVYQYDIADMLDEAPQSEDEYKEQKIEPYNPEKPRKIDGRFDFVELFIFTLLAVMILTSFFFRHTMVKGASMENTLHEGEHLIISDLFYTPKSGDIIVCEDYTTAIRKPIVKRVIAVGGDEVRITRLGEVYVNGKLLDESAYVYIDELGYRFKPIELTVPEGELFVMGDHRNDSIDSREIGTVSEDSVLGRVLIRFYPFDKFGIVK